MRRILELSSSPRWTVTPRAEEPFLRQSFAIFRPLLHSFPEIIRVAATKTPIIFLGVGEHLNDLDKFAPEPFISKLLGMGDMQGFMEHMQSVAMADPEKHKEIQKKLGEGKLSIRDWKEQIQNVMNMYAHSPFPGLVRLILCV